MHLRLLTMATATTVGVSAQTVTLADMLASQNATLSILNGFLEQQQALFNTFSNTQDITVLAPSNDALSSLPSALVDRVSTDPDYLAALLSYHVLNGTYYSSQLSAASDPVYIRTLLNSSSYSNVTGGQRIVSQVSSGAVSLGSGGQSRAALQLTDYNFTGGTVHIIDAMLSLPTNLTTTLLGANLTAAVGAIQQSGLAPSLNAELEVTVFAPTNAAFEAVGNLVAGMTAAELQSVVGYHVVEGEVLYGGMLAAGVAGGKNAATVQGGAVTFREEEGGRLFVNSARVVVADVLIANGVLHVIDGVLNPANVAATPDPAAATQAPAFSGASATGGVPFTTGIVPPSSTSAGGGLTTITVGPKSGSAVRIRRGGLGVVGLGLAASLVVMA